MAMVLAAHRHSPEDQVYARGSKLQEILFQPSRPEDSPVRLGLLAKEDAEKLSLNFFKPRPYSYVRILQHIRAHRSGKAK